MYKNKQPKIYLVSYKVWGNKRSNLWDKIISIFTLSNYSHTEILFENFKKNNINITQCFSISPRENTSRFKNIDIQPEQWEKVSIYASEKQIEHLYEICKKKTKMMYDYEGALFSPFLCLQNEKKYFCSELCTDVLNESNILRLHKGCNYTPGKLTKFLKNQIH